MGEMLHDMRIPATDAEHAAVDKLQGENPDATVSMTRRDPGDTGPLLVHVDGDTYEVAEDGKRKKLT